MKKISKYVLTLGLIAIFSFSAVLAESKLKIGVVDPEYILSQYPKAQKSINELEAKKAKIEETIRKKTQELNAAKAKKDISKTELQLIAEQGRAAIEPDLKALDDLARESSQSVKDEILEAIEKFSKDSKYDWVLLKAAVLYHKEGVIQDLNDEVLKSLAKKK